MSNIYAPPESNPEQRLDVGSQDQLKCALAGQYQFSIQSVLSQSWQLTYGIKWRTHLALIVYGIVPMLLLIPVFAVMGLFFFANGLEGFDVEGLSDSTQIASDLAGIIFSMVFMPMNIGLGMIGLKRARGQDFRISESLCYFQFYRSLFVIGLVMGIISFMTFGLPGYSLWFLIFLLPGIYLTIALLFSGFLAVDKGCSAIEAMKLSVGVMRHRWFKFFGLVVCCYLLNILGALMLLLGLLWTIPLSLVAMGVVYRDIFDGRVRESVSE